jgi:hypothetical protein
VQVVGVQDREGLLSLRCRNRLATAEPAKTSRREGAMFDMKVKGFFP